MKITQLDRPAMRLLREEIDTALATIGKKYGVGINAGRASFSSSEATFKVEVKVGAASGENATHTQARVDFERYCHLYDFKKTDLGRQFMFKGQWYKLIGLMPNRPKYPMLCQRLVGGKELLLTAPTVKAALP